MSRLASIPLQYRVAGWMARKSLQPFWHAVYLVAMRGLGYNNWISSINGEDRFARQWARAHAAVAETVIDAGANEGDFTAIMLPILTRARFHLFEPHPMTWQRLADRYRGLSNVVVEQLGLGAEEGHASLYDFKNGAGSERASFLAETFSEIIREEAASFAVDLVTLDGYAARAGIDFIDFLKIDTEGFEKQVLTGAAGLLRDNRIGTIQIEMNEHNVVSGLSLYALTKRLPNYDLYRLLPDGLTLVAGRGKPYSASVDLARYCNLIAVNRTPTRSPATSAE